MPALDYNAIAQYYDVYVATDYDFSFWLDVCKSAPKPCLELMCGTGRITMHLLRNGIEIDGLDTSEHLLKQFRKKAELEGYPTRAVLADAASFQIDRKYGTVLLGFQSISEVVENDEKKQVFQSVHEHLNPGGEFWLTIHNPVVRMRALSRGSVEIGNFKLPDGSTLNISGEYSLDKSTWIVSGRQNYRVFKYGEEVEVHMLPTRFHLIPPTELRELLEESGFDVAGEYGMYDRSPFKQPASSFYIAHCVKRS